MGNGLSLRPVWDRWCIPAWGIAAENSGKLVALVRQEARRVAENQGREWIITDGPPGIGCPVIASLGGASVVLIVTERSRSGWHDLERVAALTDHFQLPSFVLVNKADLHWPSARAIRRFCDLRVIISWETRPLRLLSPRLRLKARPSWSITIMRS